MAFAWNYNISSYCHLLYVVPDFNKLYKISQVLEEGSVFAQCIDLMENETEIERILEELLHRQKFTLARAYAILLDQPRDKVSLQQVTLPIQRGFVYEDGGKRAENEICDSLRKTLLQNVFFVISKRLTKVIKILYYNYYFYFYIFIFIL